MPEAPGPEHRGSSRAWGGDAAPASAPASRGEQTGRRMCPRRTARLPGPAVRGKPRARWTGAVGSGAAGGGGGGSGPWRGPLASSSSRLPGSGRAVEAGGARGGGRERQTFPRRLAEAQPPAEGRGVQRRRRTGRRGAGPTDLPVGTGHEAPAAVTGAEGMPKTPPGFPPAAGLRGAGASCRVGAGSGSRLGCVARAGRPGRLEAGRHGVDAAPRAFRAEEESAARQDAPLGPGRQQGRSAGARSEPGSGGQTWLAPGSAAADRAGGRLYFRRRPGAEAAALQCHPRAREPPRRSRDRGSQAVFRGPDLPKAWSRLSLRLRAAGGAAWVSRMQRRVLAAGTWPGLGGGAPGRTQAIPALPFSTRGPWFREVEVPVVCFSSELAWGLLGKCCF